MIALVAKMYSPADVHFTTLQSHSKLLLSIAQTIQEDDRVKLFQVLTSLGSHGISSAHVVDEKSTNRPLHHHRAFALQFDTCLDNHSSAMRMLGNGPPTRRWLSTTFSPTKLWV